MSQKRERELARARYERQQVRRAERAQNKRTRNFISAGIVLLVTVIVWAGNNSAKNDVANPSPSTTGVSTSPKPSISAVKQVAGCSQIGSARPNNISFASVDKNTVAGSTLTLSTNCGGIKIALDKNAPKTIQAMTFLANKKFFVGTICHRLTTSGIYVLQCGDPAGDGTGGPGFSYADENLPKVTDSGSAVYKRGTVAMANSGPATNGSQFFLVYEDSPLPPNYTVWGEITSGIELLDRVSTAGVQGGAADGRPVQSVGIISATVKP